MNFRLLRRVSSSSEPDLGWRENSIQTKTAHEQERCLRSELSSLRWIPVAQASRVRTDPEPLLLLIP